MYMGTPSILNTLLYAKRNVGYSEPLELKIHAEKIGLRNLHREREHYARPRWHYTDYDRRWSKTTVDYEMTPSERSDYVTDNWEHWYNPYEDGRDCTGVWFTTSIRIKVINGKTFIYHFQDCDI